MNCLPIALLLAALSLSDARAQLATALELNERGNRASEAGNYPEAIRLYRESLDIWRASGPAYEAHRAGTLLNLGIVVSATGDRPQTVRIMEESLALHRKTLGPRHLRTITNINLLGSNYLMIGRTERAGELFEEALPVIRELYPADIQASRTLVGMSAVLLNRGKKEEAAAAGEEALRIAIQATGEDSPDTALAYANVGSVHRAAGHNERALPLLRKARAAYEKELGPDHPRVAGMLGQEGLILLEEGKPNLAEQLLTRSLNSIENTCPKCSVELAVAENNLALLRLRQRRLKDADELLSRAVSQRESFTSVPDEELARTLRLLAQVRQKEKRFEDAERLTQRADVVLGYR